MFCDNAGISYNRVTEPLETLFHCHYINGAQKVIRQSGLTTGYVTFRQNWFISLDVLPQG